MTSITVQNPNATPNQFTFTTSTTSKKEDRLLKQLADDASISVTELKNSIALIKSSLQGSTKQPVTLTEDSRVNEQEMFAAITLSLLRKLSPKFADVFQQNFQKTVTEGGIGSTENTALKVSRRSLRELVNQAIIPQSVARLIRKISLGAAQLDADRETLKTARVVGEKETPLRSLKNALERYSTNPFATTSEHAAFKKFIANEVRE